MLLLKALRCDWILRQDGCLTDRMPSTYIWVHMRLMQVWILGFSRNFEKSDFAGTILPRAKLHQLAESMASKQLTLIQNSSDEVPTYEQLQLWLLILKVRCRTQPRHPAHCHV